MGRKWGKVDYRQLEELRDRLEQFQKVDMDAFCTKMAKELAQRLISRARKRTPVGEYETITYERKDGSSISYNDGKQGGTLRNNWKTSQIVYRGGEFRITVYNPLRYASYVEYGHRQTAGRFVPQIGKRLKAGWVEGQFMLKISEEEVQSIAPGLLEKKLNEELRRIFND